MANSILARMAVMISANTAELNKGLKDVSGQLKGFGSQLQGIAATVGVAFGTQQVLEFGLEVSKLAGQAEAVQTAFDRLPNSVKLMNELKQATGGTVSELELMKRAVQAANFDISLEALPRLLEFATLRAQQTGQSVDYLVDSIVTGIGRKSKLILDNLGISAAQLSEELKGVSTEAATVGDVADAVGRIAEKNLVNMAGFSENASTKLQRLGASWENLKVAIGDAANETGVFSKAVDSATNVMDVLAEKGLGFFDKLKILASVNGAKQFEDFKSNLLAVAEAQERLNQWDAQLLINKYNGIESAIAGFSKEFSMLSENGTGELSDSQLRQLSKFDEIMTILQKRLNEVTITQANAIDTIAEYESEIKKLTEANQNLTLSDAAQIQANGVLIDLYQKRKKALEDLAAVPFKSAAKGQPLDIASSTSLSNASIPGVTMPDKVGAPDIQKYQETAGEIVSINQQLAESWDQLAASAIVGIAEGFGSGENIGQNLLRNLAQFGRRFGAQLVALGTAKVAEGLITKNPAAIASGLKGIAAGVALVGVSTALGSSVSGGGSGAAGVGGSGIASRGSISGNVQSEQRIVIEGMIYGRDIKLAYDSATQDNRIRRG